ncbi:class I SAM-dependent methyltransferase [Coleofasciculus sp. F4-SAH-05]|uniref:class I SAM-dependent methyltransferase n=1 Tax=Coleofasciculus sp. F4-SAH-05 TaxID=3069525 RepID=UPI0032F25FF3
MSNNYTKRLFLAYSKTHISYLDNDDKLKKNRFIKYARTNYLRHINHLDKNSAKILEIGCNRGYLLSALSGFGFSNLYGVDLSPDDVKNAKTLLPNVDIICIDAYDYLKEYKEEFDLIILKAVLEHIPKNDIIYFLEQIRNSLKHGGLVIIDVPNMDWLFAQHERYMDFTHEVGFTRESLAQIMRNVFNEVFVCKSNFIVSDTLKSKIAALVRPVLIHIMNMAFRIIGEGASDVWWDNRSIIGVGKK